MAQDYDSPRNKDEDEESLQALGKSAQNTSSDIDDDENAIAEDYELPGADLSNEDS
ncbi:dUTPase, partial [Bifidobacterium breve]